MIKDGSTIYSSTSLNFKSLFTKPLKFVIQLFTSSSMEHTLFYIDGRVLEINGNKKGAQFKPIKQWVDEYVTKHTKLHITELKEDLNLEQTELAIRYCESQIGVKYSTVQASRSWLDNFFKGLNKDKQLNQYCSGQTYNCYVALGILPKLDYALTPVELLDYQIISGKFNQWRRINVSETY